MNNKGYSLLEVVIIVAILGVISGFLVTSSSLFDGRRVKACADSISSLLEKVRMTNLGKDEVTLTIYKDSDNVIKARIVTMVEDKISGRTEKSVTDDVSNDNIEVYYSTDISVNSATLLGAEGMSFSFNRSSGSVKNTSPNGIQCIVLRKGNAEKKIKIYTVTGKISIE